MQNEKEQNQHKLFSFDNDHNSFFILISTLPFNVTRFRKVIKIKINFTLLS